MNKLKVSNRTLVIMFWIFFGLLCIGAAILAAYAFGGI